MFGYTVGIVIVRDEAYTINLHYSGNYFHLERRGMDENMLFINEKLRYYISHTICLQLQTLGEALEVFNALVIFHSRSFLEYFSHIIYFILFTRGS